MRPRFPLALKVLLAYLGAITIFGKGPTYLGYPPLYWGEVVLGVSFLWAFRRDGLAGLSHPHLRPLSVLVLLMMGYGAVLTALSYPQWGLDALRDAAIWYYGAFFFVGLSIARRKRLAGRFWRVLCGLWIAALVWGICENLSDNALSKLSPVIPWRDSPVLAGSHSDVIQNMALGAILVFAMRPLRRFRPARLILPLLALLGLGLAALAWGRGVKVGLALGILCVVALNFTSFRTPRISSRLLQLLFVAALLLVAVVVILGLSIDDLGYLGRFEDVSLSSDRGSVYWRLVWWERLVDELLDRNPVFGLGFGENLGFYNPYLLGDETSAWPVRAPHSINLSYLIRMGFVGCFLWTAILTVGIGGLFRRIRAQEKGRESHTAARREELAFWILMLLTTWGNSSFGVLMEGPVLGVWFWFALGFASGRSVFFRPALAIAASPGREARRPQAGRALRGKEVFA